MAINGLIGMKIVEFPFIIINTAFDIFVNDHICFHLLSFAESLKFTDQLRQGLGGAVVSMEGSQPVRLGFETA